MNITKNQIDDLNATIKIELGKEDYAGRVEKALKDYQKKVVVNGFRPGKTPMGIVKKMYGKSLLVDEINKVLGESLNNYIKENNLQILYRFNKLWLYKLLIMLYSSKILKCIKYEC